MPFRNTRLIPAGLAERFAPTVLGSFTAHVDIRRPDQVATRDPASGRTGFAPVEPFYSGPARVQGFGAGPAAEAGSGQQLATGTYLVAVPYRVTASRIGDVVRVLFGGDDPTLTGLVLVVTDVPRATVLLQRSLMCELHEKAQRGT